MHQVLRVGDYGAEVAELQQYLASLGYAEMAMASPEVFDDVTEQVLRRFQLDHGLLETGEYDEDTWQKMAALPVADPAGSDPLPDLMQPDDLAPLEEARGIPEREFQPEAPVAVRVDPTYCVFWGFAVGSTELQADHHPLLGEIADTLLMVDPLASVDIAGHTSASGGSARNDTIAEGRAARVRDALEELGVATHRIQWWGEGENRPWLPEDQGAAAMARNRRVEVVVRLVSGIGTQPPAPQDTDKIDPGGTDPTGDEDPVVPEPTGGMPPRIRVRIIITDPPVDLPEPGPGLIDRIRQICDGLPDLLLDALEFDFDAGDLLIFGFSLSTLAALAALGPGALMALAATGLGEVLAATVLKAMVDLKALENALRELGHLTRPSSGASGVGDTPPHDAGVPIPAGVPDPTQGEILEDIVEKQQRGNRDPGAVDGEPPADDPQEPDSVLDPTDNDPTYGPEGRWRLPAAGRGTWDGVPGNSRWTPHNAADYGLEPGQSIPFRDAVPDLTEFTVDTPAGGPGTIHVNGLNGGRGDFPLADAQLGQEAGMTEEQVRQWRQAHGLTYHHYAGDELQLVPQRIHAPLAHQGSASELRP
jgi:hypothetical protein